MTNILDCVFCQIADGNAPAKVLWHSSRSMIIVPLDPVTPGHVIALPYVHVENFSEDWLISAEVLESVFQYSRNLGIDYNIITSSGRDATQSVFHLHIHIVPRRPGDGLSLPWTNQIKETPVHSPETTDQVDAITSGLNHLLHCSQK